jgi:hypothetical protein
VTPSLILRRISGANDAPVTRSKSRMGGARWPYDIISPPLGSCFVVREGCLSMHLVASIGA